MAHNAGLERGNLTSVEKTNRLVVDALSVNVAIEPTSSFFELFLREVLFDLEFCLYESQFECIYQGKPLVLSLKVKRPIETDCIFRMTRDTVILFSKAVNTKITRFDDIGGLNEEVDAIRSMIEVPLFSPQVFTQYGLRPPKGLLLYGPPGTGKTMIARAVADQMNAHAIIINGPELMSQNYGETQERLNQVFLEARENAPTIIFMDELDAMCAKREHVRPTDLE